MSNNKGTQMSTYLKQKNMEKYTMPEMEEMLKLVDKFVYDFNAFKASRTTPEDDAMYIHCLRNKYINKITNYVAEQDNYVEFEKNFPIVNDSCVNSLRLDTMTNYLYAKLGNGESVLDTDISLEDLIDIANSLNLK